MPSIRVDLSDDLKLSTPTRTVTLGTATGADPRLSMLHASTLTLTVLDEGGDLWRSPALAEPMVLTVGDPAKRYIDDWRIWRSRGVGTIGRSGPNTVLTFWDAGSAALKLKTDPLSRSATSLNLEGWVTLQASQVKDYYQLTPVVTRPNSTPPTETGVDAATTAGWSSETRSKVTIKGKPASAEQLQAIDRVLTEAVKVKATPRAVHAMVTANIGESQYKVGATNPTSGAKGIFQLMPAPGWQARMDWADVEAGVRQFLGDGFASSGGAIKLARDNPSMTPGTIASKVEGSDQGGRFYDVYATEARTTIELWSGVELAQWSSVTGPAGTDTGYGETAATRPTEWRRGRPGEPESSLKCLSRTAEGLGQRAFVAAARLVVGRDQDLILAAPHLSMSLIGDDILAERPEVQHDGNQRLTQISLRVFADQWGAPPGSVVEITDSGQVERRWLVQEVSCPSGSDVADIILQQPTTKIPKPPAKSAGSDTGQLTGTGAQVAIQWAERQVGIKELPSGSNNGPEVGKIITDNGGAVGQPWCGYFCRGALRAAGLTPPVSMAGVAWIYSASAAKTAPFSGRTDASHAKPGDLAILYGSSTHVGLITKVSGGQIHTIEGNTSLPNGGGQGCARKVHPASDVVAVAQVQYGSSLDEGARKPAYRETPSVRRPFPGDPR